MATAPAVATVAAAAVAAVVMRWWLRTCGSWWLRWWLRRGWLRRWLRWWPRLADAPPPRQGRHLVVTTGCKWSGSERLSVAVGKRGGEGSRHSPPARGEVYWHGSGRRPAPAVPVHGHRGTDGAAVHHGAGLRPAPAVPVQASGLLLHAGARCAPARPTPARWCTVRTCTVCTVGARCRRQSPTTTCYQQQPAPARRGRALVPAAPSPAEYVRARSRSPTAAQPGRVRQGTYSSRYAASAGLRVAAAMAAMRMYCWRGRRFGSDLGRTRPLTTARAKSATLA